MVCTEGNTNREYSFYGWDGGVWMDGREQKIGGGDVRAEASSWDGEWDKANAFAPSKHRVGTVFSANNIPPLRNIIVFDNFVTTGQTLVSMQNLLVSLGKNCTFFAGINTALSFNIRIRT